jgi:uncharacterized membrane protein
MTALYELRARAREALAGNWGYAILAMVITGIITSAVSFTFVGSIIISGPLSLGLAFLFLNRARREEVKIDSVFKGFNYFLNSFLLGLLRAIFIFLWALLLIIPGIVKSYSYAMSFYIMADNPEMDAMQALKASREMMDGYKWRLFCLDLSFIGWALLCLLTLGIGFLFLMPYVEAAHIQFYEDIKGPVITNEQPA